MVLPKPLLLAVSLVLVGCAGLGFSPDPPRHLVDVDSVGPTFRPGQRDEDAVRAQATVDLGCATGIVVRSNSNAAALRASLGLPGVVFSDDGSAFRADGCGQVISYVVVTVWGASSRVPGYAGEETRVTLRRFVPISREGADAALAALERDAAALALVHHPVQRGTVDEWVALSNVAARELGCPRESLVVDIVKHSKAPSTYLAEGCGTRGLFVTNSAGTLVLTSRVALIPGHDE